VNVLDSHRNPSPDLLEQTIYQHLLDCVRTENPDQVLERFQQLFIQYGTYPEYEMRVALDSLLRGGSATQRFLPFFNRCCFILINRWQLNPLERSRVAQLVDLLNQVRGPSIIVGQPSPSGRLRFAVQEYVRSPLFGRLRQLAEFLNPQKDQDERQPLSTLLYRYPYLYSHCMTKQEDEADYLQMISTAKKTAQKKFEQDLSSYLTHSLLAQNSLAKNPVMQNSASAKVEIKNPTLLSSKEIASTLKTYLSKVDSRGTYRDLAQQFWTPAYQPRSYAEFKTSLHEYLMSSIPAKYGSCRFNDQLHGYLKNLYPESAAAPLSDFLVVRTCNQVLNFMVIESKQRPAHSVFMDLLNNLGSTLTVGLVLKVVLLCGKTKPYLDRRFSVLFQHYESQTRSSVRWLVGCLEKLNLAWCAHFGSQNLSYVNLL
jgi:hypothetical protein